MEREAISHFAKSSIHEHLSNSSYKIQLKMHLIMLLLKIKRIKKNLVERLREICSTRRSKIKESSTIRRSPQKMYEIQFCG